MGSAFDMHRAEREGDSAIILSGEIDISNAEHLARALNGAISNLDHGLILDLSGLTYVDSAGIRVLFELSRRLKDHQQRLVLVVPEGSGVRRSLTIGGLLRSVEVLKALPQDELETDS